MPKHKVKCKECNGTGASPALLAVGVSMCPNCNSTGWIVKKD